MRRILLGLAVAASMASGGEAMAYDVAEKSVAQLQADMAAKRVTAEEVVQAYLSRIEAMDRQGPKLHSVIAVNPEALAAAKAADAARRAGKANGPLFGIPVLVKDNIETTDPMATTAGSLALKDNITHRDSPSIARLRAAGAIILGKTNLSEWANIRSFRSISGWSAIGGLAKNPYVLDRSTCGSSSGSGAAVAASLATVAVGTETDGSLVCPGSVSGVVSLKPTVGLVSRTHVVPISHTQDTPGPMGRSVADVAALLTAMAGSDPADTATADADARKTDYLKALRGASLKGVRVGVISSGNTPPLEQDEVFTRAVDAMKNAGAVIVPVKIPEFDREKVIPAEFLLFGAELKADLNAYLATTPDTVKTRTLADVIAFNAVTPRETTLFGQEIFEQVQAQAPTLTDPAYLAAKELLRKTTREDCLDKLLDGERLDVLVQVTNGPSWRVDLVKGDNDSGNSSFLPAAAGYPHLTVPMGAVRGLPVGMSFVGRAWSEAKLLAIGAAFEKATAARMPPAYQPSLEGSKQIEAAFAPHR